MGQSPEVVVRALLSALEAGPDGHDAVLALFAEDASYCTNAWHPPHVGHAAIRAELERQAQLFVGFRSEVVQLLADDACVLVERLDHITLGGRACTLHFMGSFTVGSDGLITSWRDTYDMDEVRAAASP